MNRLLQLLSAFRTSRSLSSTCSSSSSLSPDSQLVLRSDTAEGITTLTLNRPKAYNSLSLSTMEAMILELNRVKSDKSVKVVILCGAGRGFCSGHDLKELRQNKSREFYEKTFNLCSEMMLSIINLPQPVIASVHGIATAAGCQLVATCDLAVGSEESKFATPGVNIGLFCSTPMVALSRNLSRKASLEMLLLGDFISAQQALQFGLLNRVVQEEKRQEEVFKLALQIAKKSSYVLKIGKKAFYEQAQLSVEEAYKYCGRVMTENMLARDAEEGISAFLDKRNPTWTNQ